MKFFLDAGIPPDSSAQYAVTFETNRMGMDMLMDLDKEYLRDLNITALGDIISILKHAKGATAKKAADEVLLSDVDNGSEKPTLDKSKTSELKPSTSSKSKNIVANPSKKESFVMSRRLGIQLHESDSDPPSPAMDTGKSVFSRLGDQQSDDSEVETKSTKAKAKVEDTSPGASKRQGGSSIFERLGPESDRDQEARVTSTTSTAETSASPHPTRGILKKRGTGDGAGMAKSKSTSNIISLKTPTIKDMKKKRISFGENEIKTMEPKPDIKSRLGYGKCNSPPPPEISEPALKTEIKKIAIGGGRFEMKKIMKVVNADKTIASELGRTSSAGIFSQEETDLRHHEMENLSIAVKNDVKPVRKQLKVAIKNEMVEEEYKVDKVDLALRAAKLKVARNQARAAQSLSDSESKPKKRLAKYEAKPDGTVEKQYIDYNDPILDIMPIKKKKSEEMDHMIKKTEKLKMKSTSRTPVKITKDRTATNFQVVRPSSCSSSSGSTSSLFDDSTHITLAQKAVLARSKQETFQTLASRASHVQKRSLSPEEEKSRKTSGAKMDERKLSLKSRLDEGRSSESTYRASKSPSKSIKDRMGSRERDKPSPPVRDMGSSRDRSPVSLKTRIGSRERSPLSVRDRVGSRDGDMSPVRRERAGSGGDKKIFSRLGPRE